MLGVAARSKGIFVSAVLLGGCASLPSSPVGVPLMNAEATKAECTIPAELHGWRVFGFGNTDLQTRIKPPFGQGGRERTEARYQLTVDVAACVSKVRVYEDPHELLGPNSSSGLRAAMRECGIPLPEHIPGRGGLLASFPGVDHEAGRVRLNGPLDVLGLPSIFEK